MKKLLCSIIIAVLMMGSVVSLGLAVDADDTKEFEALILPVLEKNAREWCEDAHSRALFTTLIAAEYAVNTGDTNLSIFDNPSYVTRMGLAVIMIMRIEDSDWLLMQYNASGSSKGSILYSILHNISSEELIKRALKENSTDGNVYKNDVIDLYEAQQELLKVFSDD